MTPILLAIALHLGQTNATVRFQTPQAGAYCLLESRDMLTWYVRASGSVQGQEHVTATLRRSNMGFVKVEFQPRIM